MLLVTLPQMVATTMLLEGQEPRHRRTEATFASKISLAIVQRKRLPVGMSKCLSGFPAAVYDSGALMMKREDLAEKLLTEPHLALMAVYGCPSLAAQLEQTIFLNSETFYEYEVWRREEQHPRFSNDEQFKDALCRDVFWSYRLYRATQDASLLDVIVPFCEEHRFTVPGAALLWLTTHENESGDKYVDALQKSPQHAYLAKRLAPIQAMNVDEGEIEGMTPRWACHFALLRPAAVPASILEKILECPGWTIEFLVRGKLMRDPALVLRYLQQAQVAAQAETQPIRTSMRGYYNTWSAEWVTNFASYVQCGRLEDHLSKGIRLPAPAAA